MGKSEKIGRVLAADTLWNKDSASIADRKYGTQTAASLSFHSFH